MPTGSTFNPMNPPSYIAGTITISAGQAGTPQSLLTLIQNQLNPNCPGSGMEVNLQTDDSGALFVGVANKIGALSNTNYGYQLGAGGVSRTYRTSFPGASSPVGSLQVLMNSAGTFHVEVNC